MLSDRDDLWINSDIAPRAANRGRMAAPDLLARIRSPFSTGAPEKFGSCRHGYDREPGWLGPSHKHDARPAVFRRKFPSLRPQMVHVGADVRRVPCTGSGAERLELFFDAAMDAGRRAQRDSYTSTQGQTRQPFECIERG